MWLEAGHKESSHILCIEELVVQLGQNRLSLR